MKHWPHPEGRTVLVCGASGRSGRAAARLCLHLGARVVLSDRVMPTNAGEPASGESWEGAASGQLLDARPREDAALLIAYRPDFLIVAPGVPLTNEIFVKAEALGIPVFGENDYAFGALKARDDLSFLAITGTDGKSTTTAMTAHLIREGLGRPAVECGNFGLPLSEIALSEPDPGTVLVVECSSFQLEPTVFFRPLAAALLNVAPDHQDRYRDQEAYLAAKLRIARNLTPDDILFAPLSMRSMLAARSDLPLAPTYIDCSPGREWSSSEQVAQVAGQPAGEVARAPQSQAVYEDETYARALRLPGAHNRCNLLFALALCESFAKKVGLSLSSERLLAAIESFRGLPHRMELVGEVSGIRVINDSKATTMQAVTRAVEAFGQGEGLHHLIGGRSKGADFSSIRGLAPAARIYPFGEAAGEIARVLEQAESFGTLRAALAAAVQSALLAGAGGTLQVILLSPGCSSFDEFHSFEDRGLRFKQYARELLANLEARA